MVSTGFLTTAVITINKLEHMLQYIDCLLLKGLKSASVIIDHSVPALPIIMILNLSNHND